MGLDESVWVLDDGPLDMLAAEVPPGQVASWPPGVLYVASATEQASLEPGSRRQTLLAAASQGGQRVFETFDVTVGSTAGRILFGHLRKGRNATADLAEHQAIAWALAEQPRATIVTCDKAAATLALAELGRARVCHALEFWKNLQDESLVTASQWEALSERLLRADTSLPGLPWRYQDQGQAEEA